MGLLNLPMGHFIPGKGKTLSKVTQTLQRSKTLMFFFNKKQFLLRFVRFWKKSFLVTFWVSLEMKINYYLEYCVRRRKSFLQKSYLHGRDKAHIHRISGSKYNKQMLS